MKSDCVRSTLELNVQFHSGHQIEKLFALEPFPPLVKVLKKTITARGPDFQRKTVVIPLGIQEKSLLRSEYGLAKESVDSLVLVQCLCSMPQPKKHLKYCVELLKPGGTLILVSRLWGSRATVKTFY